MSLTDRRPVLTDLAQFLPASMELTLTAVLLVVLVGLPVGLIAGVRRGQPVYHILRFLTVGGGSMPVFLVGVILPIIFYKQLGLLPIRGRLPRHYNYTPPPDPVLLVLSSFARELS